jgi:23S rRNA pseudouridine1911/1915/1917 synthase
MVGGPVKASMRLVGGERVIVTMPPLEETDLIAQAIPLDIQYEDDDLLLINKPAGMVVHPAKGHESGTLVNAVLAHCPDLPGIGGERRPGVVHRLDKDTSGLILVAKNDLALRYLQAQFKQRTVEKVYIALAVGHFRAGEALIDAPIGRDPRNRKRMAVIPPNASDASRPAQTKVRLIEYYGRYSLLECKPLTGRTHQIRVHLAFANCPIVGDKVYGGRKQTLLNTRHFLHASALTFNRPSDGRKMDFGIPLPQELADLLAELD